ncbi:MAG: lipoate--protein ligase family protein [Spirochaetaceae bacterium]|nr:MAG: lipoate--protein ligase family protein [Spirochaetaceae bacterium]
MIVTPGTRFRLILDDPGDGQLNMAVDEALLESVGEGRSPATVRLYGFAPPTLSFGRFQRIKEKIRWQAVQEDGITLVRRPTGGQAVLHDQELTYAVVLSKDQLEPFQKREIYRFIAELLLEGLARLGIRGQSNRKRSGDLHNPDCFRSTGEYEIASFSAKKLIGSAQVVNRSASLQHGAVPLDMSYRRIDSYLAVSPGRDLEEPSCLSGELGRPMSFQQAVKAFAEGFDSALHRRGVKLQTGALKREEILRAEELLQRKYSGDEWNLLY